MSIIQQKLWDSLSYEQIESLGENLYFLNSLPKCRPENKKTIKLARESITSIATIAIKLRDAFPLFDMEEINFFYRSVEEKFKREKS